MKRLAALLLIVTACASGASFSSRIDRLSRDVDTAAKAAIDAFSVPGSGVTPDQLKKAGDFAKLAHDALALGATAALEYETAIAADPNAHPSQVAIIAAMTTATANIAKIYQLIDEWKRATGKPVPVAQLDKSRLFAVSLASDQRRQPPPRPSFLSGVTCNAGRMHNATGLFCAVNPHPCCGDASGPRTFSAALDAEGRLSPLARARAYWQRMGRTKWGVRRKPADVIQPREMHPPGESLQIRYERLQMAGA